MPFGPDVEQKPETTKQKGLDTTMMLMTTTGQDFLRNAQRTVADFVPELKLSPEVQDKLTVPLKAKEIVGAVVNGYNQTYQERFGTTTPVPEQQQKEFEKEALKRVKATIQRLPLGAEMTAKQRDELSKRLMEEYKKQLAKAVLPDVKKAREEAVKEFAAAKKEKREPVTPQLDNLLAFGAMVAPDRGEWLRDACKGASQEEQEVVLDRALHNGFALSDVLSASRDMGIAEQQSIILPLEAEGAELEAEATVDDALTTAAGEIARQIMSDMRKILEESKKKEEDPRYKRELARLARLLHPETAKRLTRMVNDPETSDARLEEIIKNILAFHLPGGTEGVTPRKLA